MSLQARGKGGLDRIRQVVFVSATPGPYELAYCEGEVVEQLIRPTGLIDPQVEVRPATHQVDDLLAEIRTVVARGERVLVTTLTKRMAEDLTEYLAEHDIGVRYMHSDIDTVERMEILRDLRMGVFDVLIGINLLREGLDMPEVSLVAILDADKEGFLRSERSLIQTIGRAARNVAGRAILYADNVTKSMQAAIGETDRRRAKQEEYNTEHGITPQTIKKAIADVMEGARNVPGAAKKTVKGGRRGVDAVEIPTDPKVMGKLLRQLEDKMLEHAKNLEFEEAAAVRDQLGTLREHSLLLG